ncbi:ATP-binding protein [Streptomyces sp. NPDC006290]|uniref:sensor histidine kinase n=1 Tax=Streptomyces sp. NPDC006290 TaxID=3156745 RepID=UPI0033BD348C
MRSPHTRSLRTRSPHTRSLRTRSLRPRPPHTRSLRTRLFVLIGLALVAVCATMAFTTVLAQRAYLLGDLDRRVGDAAERSRDGVLGGPGVGPGVGTDLGTDLGFPDARGQPVGTISARLDDGGAVVEAKVVSRSGAPRDLGVAQRSALAGIEPDGSLHTRTVPGLGTYRVTALGGGRPVLTALPMDDVQDMISRLAVVEGVVAAAGLTVVGSVCAVVVRRQLRPLGRVAATAVEISRSPLGHAEMTGLTRVLERDAGAGSEAGQVGAALNRLIDHAETSVAQRLRGEEELREEKRRGEERMRRFLADASHELRTPLASIAGYAELMDRGAQWLEPALAWRRVAAESARMTGLVEDLLLLARLDEGRPLGSSEVDLAALVTEAVWEARATGEDHTWQLDPLPDSPALVAGDEARLHQVVANLLANARAHTPAGTTVVATVEATGMYRTIRVRDDGPGIPPALLPSVFERFTRADASRSRVSPGHGGSGLGLAVAAAITTAHHGRIHAESAPGRTEFTVELPAAAARAPVAGPRGPDPEECVPVPRTAGEAVVFHRR